jgi:hypothetical protein
MDDELRAEREQDKRLLNEAADTIERLQAELNDLAEGAAQWRAERDQLADVLKGPGVRKLLIRTYHSDLAAGLNAAERKRLDVFTAMIIVAYDLIDTIDKPAESEPAGCLQSSATVIDFTAARRRRDDEQRGEP